MKKLSVLFLGFVPFALSGCVNSFGQFNTPSVPKGSLYPDQSGQYLSPLNSLNAPNGMSTIQGFNCANTPNVNPEYDYGQGASFTACASSLAASGTTGGTTSGSSGTPTGTDPTLANVLIVSAAPLTASNNQVCVFPVETNGQQSYVIPDFSTGTAVPLHLCQTLSPVAPTTGSELSAIFSFTSATYNAVIVVQATDGAAMLQCLETGDPSQCPKGWAYGQFR